MEEIELKYLEVNKKEIEEKIKKLGGKKVFEGKITSVYYNAGKEKILRVRKIGRKSKLCVKKRLKDKNFKKMIEVEEEVEDFKKTKQLIKLLGYKEISTIKKKRIIYKIKNVEIDLDKYPKIPWLVEIEGAKKEIKKYEKLLGLKDGKKWDVFEVFRFYGLCKSK